MIGRGFREFFFGPSLLAKVIQNNRLKDKRLGFERLVYGDHPQQVMHIFQPSTENRRTKLVVFIHGGAWRVGSPELFRFIGLFFARLGFVTVLPGYRLAPRHRFPAQLNDVADALSTLVEWANKQAIPFDGILLGGYSAGAQLAALIAYNQHESVLRGFDRRWLSGLILVSGPLNFAVCRRKIIKLAIFDYLGSIFGWRKADPIHYITGRESIPVLCIHGQDDTLVDIENSISFAAKINARQKGLAELVQVKGACHSDLLRIFWGELKEVHHLTSWLQRIAPAPHPASEEVAASADLKEGQEHQNESAQHTQEVGVPPSMGQVSDAAAQRGA